ncbi:MAG: hypothetical protein QOH96_3852 [Blastocatellia bacterium]|nr:hypothetical protein [Blastocatellia bacterium]
MHSRNFLGLLGKEWRELQASRSFWLLLLIIGPLVGHSFITAVGLYSEMSGGGGGPAALPQGLTPLDGILVPTFGAYDLAATFLFPFVAIRMISAEKESGGLKLLLQLPGTLGTKITAKGLILIGGWIVSLLPGLLAIALWKSYGGHLYAPETLNLLLGHLLRITLSAGIAVAAAAIAESAASAAIVTLAITVGTWALDFVAIGRGGVLQQLANYTPTAALRFFEHGLLRVNSVAAMIAIGIAGFAIAAIWLQTGRSILRKCLWTVGTGLILAIIMAGAAGIRKSWDVSENRRTSFSTADEAALSKINQPLLITVYLAPEDPRLTDFEQNVLSKLRRTLTHVDVDYAANSRSGLFENVEDHYGEIWYQIGQQKIMERSTIEQVVLEQIYKLASVEQPQPAEENEFPGFPLAAAPKAAPWIFYGILPLMTLLAWWFVRREA